MYFASITIKYCWLIILCCNGSSLAEKVVKTGINNNLLLSRIRHKRQALDTGRCFKIENYSCTKTVPSNSNCNYYTYPNYCGFLYPTVISSTCQRKISTCCDGYIEIYGQCTRIPAACRNQVTVLTSKSGSIKSPNYPNTYPNNLNCNWEIRSDPGATINLKVSYIYLQAAQSHCYYWTCRSVCNTDQLIISDGNNTLTLCGTYSNNPIYTTTSGTVSIRFLSDLSFAYTGFYLTYNIQEVPTRPPTTAELTTSTTTFTRSFPNFTYTTTTSFNPAPTTPSHPNPLPPTATPITFHSNPPPITTTTTTTPPKTTTPEETTFYSTTTVKSLLSTESNYNSSSNNTTNSNTDARDLSNILNCRGDQTVSYNAPLCKKTCKDGTVVSQYCEPVFRDYYYPACVCPFDRPVFKGTSCITAATCMAYSPRRCFGSKRYTTCLPKCTQTCKNYNNLAVECKQPPSYCISGCTCPSSLPILHNGHCILKTLCPKPKPKIVECGTQYHEPNVRIVGGKRSVQGSWPWIAQIIKGFAPNRKFQCGGTVICANWILTAAHCFQQEGGYAFELEPYIYEIRIGKHAKWGSVSSNIVNQTAERIIIHPRYNSISVAHDIALIRISIPIKMTKTIRPACLPTYSPPQGAGVSNLLIGATCFVIGWGATNNKGPSNEYLKQAKIQVRLATLCDGIYSRFDTRKSLCVGGYSMNDACSGDSGGPLLCKHGERWYVDGVTSYGLKCGVKDQPGVYTRVTSYSDWIINITGNSCGNKTTKWPLTQ